jgi:hypothetical protein
VAPGGNKIADLTSLDPDVGEVLAGVLVAVELQDIGDAQARAEQYGEEGVVAQPLLGAMAGPHAQRLRGVEQTELLEAGEALPGGREFQRRLDPVRRAAEGEQAREFAVEPAGNMPHGGIDTDEGGLGEALPPEVFQEGLGHRDEPFLRPLVAVELVIEGEEAVEVTVLGIEGGLRLARHFGRELECGQVRQTFLRGLDKDWNVMG